MSRSSTLVAIATGLAAVACGFWLWGLEAGSPVLSFAGLMAGATTFVPLPADTFVLTASTNLDAVTIGVVGGVVNAVVILVERRWLLAFVDHPSFGRFTRLFEQHRFVAWTRRNMFLGLLIGGASFLPFEPFRLVAVLQGYSPIRYAAATFISRGGRYYVLAMAGGALWNIGFLQQAIWFTLLLFFLGLWRGGVKLLDRTALSA